MTDPTATLSRLRRPSLLVQAAHLALKDFNRDRSSRKIFGEQAMGSATDRVQFLFDAEAIADAERRAGDAAYSVPRHIELLTALIFETRLLANTPD